MLKGRPTVGDTAPDFALTNELGEQVKLSDYIAKGRLVLAFYKDGVDRDSLEWLKSLNNDYLAIKGLDADVLAISRDSERASLQTAGMLDLSYRLLCDTIGVVQRAYGVDDVDEKPLPSAFIIGRSGKIAYMRVGKIAQDIPSTVDIIVKLRNMEQEAPHP